MRGRLFGSEARRKAHGCGGAFEVQAGRCASREAARLEEERRTLFRQCGDHDALGIPPSIRTPNAKRADASSALRIWWVVQGLNL